MTQEAMNSGESNAAASNSLLEDVGGMMEVETEAGILTDAATTSSDAAVVLPPPKYHHKEAALGCGECSSEQGYGEDRQSTLSEAGGLTMPDATAALLAGGHHYISAHARRRHHRKRALSKANSSGTIETSGSMAEDENANNDNMSSNNNYRDSSHLSSESLMNSSTIGSNIMSAKGAEHSIVSFGRNFNFDSTSSPSNSDSGEGAVNDRKGGGGEGSNSDDDNNDESNRKPVSIIKTSDGRSSCKPDLTRDDRHKTTNKHHTHHRMGCGTSKTPHTPHQNRNENDSGKAGDQFPSSICDEGKFLTVGKISKSRSNASVKAVPEATAISCGLRTAGEGGSGSSSTSSGSDSSMNDMNNDYGGSASGGSNSGNDGSSGGKSTISSLTTSSNQEWMASNKQWRVGAVVTADAKVSTTTSETVRAESSCLGVGSTGMFYVLLNRISSVFTAMLIFQIE